MAETALSATESALENQRFGGLQIRASALCALIQMCDGYDVGSIGWAVPSLTHAWDLPPSAFSLAFLWSNLGVLVGPPERALALHYALGIVFVALIALLAMPYLGLLTILFLAGTTIIGSQTGANAACGALYPARMRTSGIGWALGIGRLGGIAAAPLGGFLLARGLPAPQIFLSACFFALVAATATALLVLRGRPSTPPADPCFPAGLA
jgi:MFS family permease